MVDVDLPGLEHLAPPSPGRSANSRKKEKKNTCRDVFEVSERPFPIGPPMLGAQGSPPLVAAVSPSGDLSRESNGGKWAPVR